MSVILNFRNALILVLSYCLSTAFAASLKTNTVYNNGAAVITLPAVASVNEIRATTCSSLDSTQTGSKTCVKSQFSQNLAPTTDASGNKKITITNTGVSLLQIFGQRRQWQSPAWPNPLEYEQLIFVRESPTSEISDLANKYNPLLSFHSEEKYLPIALSSIFNIPISNWSETNIEFNEPSSTSAGEILSKYASPSNYAFLDKDSAKSLTGSKNSFPAYFLHELNGDKLWISYIYFFGYDEKTENSPANHQLDRESIIIQFARVNNQWSPEGVVYAGHLPEQPTEFLGSEKTGTALTRWDGGKSFVRWADVSKGFNGNPLVYVARGSHALFPALGWFNVINVGVIPNLKEPAGGSHEGSSGELSYLDMSKNIGLTFSGSIVDGLGSGAKNSRFPPFIRMPLQNFAASAGTNFSDCVSNKQGCEKYINQAIAPAITDLTFTPATANTAAKLTALFSIDMQSGYLTTGAYSPMVGKEGYWPDARTFVVEFSSVTSGGQITLVASGFKSVSGQPMAADRVYTFPAQPTQSLQAFISSLETTPVNLAGIAVSGSDIYVASLIKDLSKVRSNYDNTPFYKSNIIVTKIADKDVKWQKTIASDFYIANETGNLWQTNIGFSSDGTKLLVAASSYTGSAYSMAGGKFIVNIASPDTQSYTSLYSDDNLGWFPYFSNGQLNHFSYAGYYGCIETSCNRSIDPTAFVTESHNKILQAIGLTGNLTAPMSGLRTTMISRLKQLAGV